MSGFTLRVEDGPDAGRTFTIPLTGGVIGRQAGLEFTLTDPLISRRHVRVEVRDGQVWLIDLGSANGTLLNGQPLSAPTEFRPGDDLILGYSRLQLVIASGADASADSASPPAAERQTVVRAALEGVTIIRPAEADHPTIAPLAPGNRARQP